MLKKIKESNSFGNQLAISNNWLASSFIQDEVQSFFDAEVYTDDDPEEDIAVGFT